MSMLKVEYKDTITIQFETKRYSSASGEIENVEPDTFEAYVETSEISPKQIAELTSIQTINSYTYWVNFYASESTNEEIISGNAYYIAFYWEKDSVKKCERQGVVVVPDV